MMRKGTIYLVHLDRKLGGRCQHYIGWALDANARLEEHKTGLGSRFLAEANRRKIKYRIVRQWPGNRQLERELKNIKKARLLCPVCQQKALK